MPDTTVTSHRHERVAATDPPTPAAARPAVQVVKRDGRTVPYDRSRVAHAVEMAFRAEAGVPYPDALDATLHDAVEAVADRVERTVLDTLAELGPVEIEGIQDEVERQLMAGGHYAVARRYILYREARAARRKGQRLRIREASGRETVLDAAVLRSTIVEAAAGLGVAVDVDAVYRDALATLYEGGTRGEVTRAMIYAARARIEREPECTYLAARLLLDHIYAEAIGRPVTRRELNVVYAEQFAGYLDRGRRSGLLDPRLLEFDGARLANALRAERDLAFAFMGVQTLYDRYLLSDDGRRFELPQWFWMRVAMGLALSEPLAERDARAIEFYDVLSTFAFCSSTPTLFNAGTRHPQLSSCFLSTVPDDLGDIFKAIRQRPPLEVERRPGQRLDARSRARESHPRHERTEPGRGPVPQGGQRHGGRGEPGREAAGCGVRVPRDVASGHRGVPRAAQEYGRRAPPHARHAHRQLDSGPVHVARA